jgi:hypothetical protein
MEALNGLPETEKKLGRTAGDKTQRKGSFCEAIFSGKD